MPTMANINIDNFPLFCMFKGEWGTRKSTQAMSFPGPQYWVSWDNKMEGIYLPMKLWGVDPSTIHYDDYNDWGKVETKLKRFQVECPYKTIVIDNISSGGDAINSQTLATKQGSTTKDGAAAGKSIGGIAVNTMEDFNAEASAFQSLTKILRDVRAYHKVNIILIAHVVQIMQRTSDNKTHISRSIVTGGQKAAAKIPAYCHEVYHFNMKGDFGEPKYSILTSHSRDDFARTCLPLDKEIVFEDKPIYQSYILPALKSLKDMKSALPQKF